MRSMTPWVPRWKPPAARRRTRSSGSRRWALVAAFIGKIKDDLLGRAYSHDIRAAGVGFATKPAVAGPSTGRCYVLVTPDGERTMNTYLGAAQDLQRRRYRRRCHRGERDRLSRRLFVGSAERQGGVSQSGKDRAPDRPQGGADFVGCVLRRPLARRVSAADALAHRRSDFCQRGRTAQPLSKLGLRRRDSGTARRYRRCGGDAQREGLPGDRPRRRRGGAGVPGRPRCRYDRGRATCLPPGSSAAWRAAPTTAPAAASARWLPPK